MFKFHAIVTSYDITLDKKYTVNDFINTVLCEFPADVGKIDVYDNSGHIAYCTYENGKLIASTISKDMDKEIIKATSNGGHNLMNYQIYI